MSTTGSCGCCGTIVDIAQGQSCDEPGLCVAYCGEDGGGDGPHDAGTSQ